MGMLVDHRHTLVVLVDYQTIREINSPDIQVVSLAIPVGSTATLVASLRTRAASLDIPILSRRTQAASLAIPINRVTLVLNRNGGILAFNQINLVIQQVVPFHRYTHNFLMEEAVAPMLVAILLVFQLQLDQVRNGILYWACRKH